MKSWKSIQGQAIQKDFISLFNNELAFIKVDNFLDSKQCELLAKQLEKRGLTQYNYNFELNQAPPANHLFETHYLYEEKTPAEYFPKAKESLIEYLALCQDVGFDPGKKVFQYLSQTSGLPYEIAQQDGHNYTYVIARELASSAMLHADFAAFIPSYWSISNITAEYAWNIYLTHPGTGGECIVYNKPWEKEDDKHIIQDTYGYSHTVVEGKEKATISVNPGDLVFFNSRNFHEVKASTAKRLSVGGHIGLTPENKLLAWV